jgi:glycosyltransferase involved in cell wall biosynthesis
LKSGKLTFHDNERRYKSIFKYLKWPIYTYNSLFLNKGYMLCASAYASRDFGLSGLRADKCFKWGYYTKVHDFDINAHLFETSSSFGQISIMWCSRFLDWKHPELPIKLAYVLKRMGYSFVIDMFGTGKELDYMKRMAQRLGVEDVVRFCDSCPNDEILKEMRSHEIFLCTSDQYEGWGAVLNEAMASGCAVVASHQMGAAPYLIKDGHNGMIFKSCDLESLIEKVVELIENKKIRDSIRREAYVTMKNVWNAEVASRNFIALVESLLYGTPCNIKEGPCSPAPRINHNWM